MPEIKLHSRRNNAGTLPLRILVLVATVLFFSCNRSQSNSDHTLQAQSTETHSNKTAIQNGIDYLVSQQDTDGIWHSPNYGNLRDGAAISGLALYAISHQTAADLSDIRTNIELSFQTLKTNSGANKFISNPGGPDYSNYATAFYLLASKGLDLELKEDHKRRLLHYLVSSQLTFESAGVDHGGWDYSGWMTGERPTPGTNVSITCVVAECLQVFRETLDSKEAISRAIVWARRTQNDDGGFCFHPKRSHDGNKAGWTDENRTNPNSYGSTTADGVRLLIALGVSEESQELKSAVNWLEKNLLVDRVPGFESLEQTGGWDQGLLYYWFYSASCCLQQLPKEKKIKFAKSMKKRLEELQKPDGSWTNPNARMREDDPLIATSFALIALANCEKALDAK